MFFFKDRHLSDIKRTNDILLLLKCGLNSTFIHGASPHYFQLDFFISMFPETFYIPTHILQLHKINGVTEGRFKEERKILFLDSSNLDVLRMLVIFQFLHQNERRRKSGKNKCVFEQCCTSMKE